MTDLSPAAQAVLDAYWKSPWDPSLQHEDRMAIAAALRAAVAECAYKQPVHPDSLLTESIIEADDLLAIATELENQ